MGLSEIKREIATTSLHHCIEQSFGLSFPQEENSHCDCYQRHSHRVNYFQTFSLLKFDRNKSQETETRKTALPRRRDIPSS